MLNRIVDETPVDDGTGFIRFSTTYFVTKFISYTTTNMG
jgi:hypothetical protein